MAKRSRRKAPATPDILVCECPMFIHFSREVIAEREMMRRLAHRAVDLVIDSGRHYMLGLEVAFSLSFIARDHVTDMVTDLVHDVWAEEKEPRCG